MTDEHRPDEHRTPPPGPAFTITEAAEAAGKHRTTIDRRLRAGSFGEPGSPGGPYRGVDGAWRIPKAALMAVYRLHAPAGPDAEAPAPDELRELRDDLEAERHRREEAERRADVAEALARERLERVDDLRTALRALEAGARRPEAPSEPEEGTEAHEEPEEPSSAAQEPPSEPLNVRSAEGTVSDALGDLADTARRRFRRWRRRH